MFAVLEIPNFSLQALLRLRPELCGQPVGVLRGQGRRAVVAEVSPEATHISIGTSAAQALADCPGIRLLAPESTAEREADALLLSAAWGLSPQVEPSASGRCTIDLSGVAEEKMAERAAKVLAGLARHQLHARAGIGSTPLIARYAAFRATAVFKPEDECDFLAGLPVAMLDPTEDEARLLADLGLRSLGAITAFPRAAFANRLARRGDELWSRAAGEWNVPLQPAPFPTRYVSSLELEEAIATLEPLLFMVRRFCERLAEEVGQFGGGTNRIALQLALENGAIYQRDFALPEPTAKPDVLFSVLENHLSNLQTDTAITGVTVEAFPARRLEQQEGLFDTGVKDAPMFFSTLARLAAVVGSDCVGTPRRLDTHRPDAITLVSPRATVPELRVSSLPEPHGPLLLRFRPPAPATVELTDGLPTYVVSEVVNGPAAIVRRPFRASGDWWSGEAWAREEWDVQVRGGLYRLLHEPSGWFIDGVYD